MATATKHIKEAMKLRGLNIGVVHEPMLEPGGALGKIRANEQ